MSIIENIALNATTSTVILEENTSRESVWVSNNSTNAAEFVWVKLQSAETDNDKKGILIPALGTVLISALAKYTDEISAIAASGTPTVSVTEI